MDNQTIFAIIGYIASIILAISLLMKSLIRLRVLNGIGALIYLISVCVNDLKQLIKKFSL
jgi:hypothetical protein